MSAARFDSSHEAIFQLLVSLQEVSNSSLPCSERLELLFGAQRATFLAFVNNRLASVFAPRRNCQLLRRLCHRHGREPEPRRFVLFVWMFMLIVFHKALSGSVATCSPCGSES